MEFKYYINKYLLIPLGDFFQLTERLIISDRRINYPPIFIIGPARSGTTLAYQVLISSFSLCYVNNLISSLKYTPSLASVISYYLGSSNTSIDFSSNYGRIPGWSSPSQGNRIWGRWFRGEGPGHDINHISAKDFRRLIATLEAYYKVPFITKWPGFSVYLDQLSRIVDGPIFVNIKRDPVEIIPSILKGRVYLKGGETNSISRSPKHYKNFRNFSPIDQVAAYVVGIENDIEYGMNKIGKERFFTIEYERLCECPNDVMDEFFLYYKNINNYDLKRINNNIGKFIKSEKVNSYERDVILSSYNKIKIFYDELNNI